MYACMRASSSTLRELSSPFLIFIFPCLLTQKPVRQDGGLVAKFKISWPFGHAMFDFAFYDLDSLRRCLEHL